ncbi:hypothetical protein Tco_0718199 [Tanacetum coccineum]
MVVGGVRVVEAQGMDGLLEICGGRWGFGCVGRAGGRGWGVAIWSRVEIFHPYPFQTIIKSCSNVIECSVAKLVKFINTHQLILLVSVLIDESSGIGAKPFEVAFLECVKLVIISSNGDPIQMFIAMPFDNLNLRDSDDSTSGIYIRSRFPIDSKSIELFTFVSPIVMPIELLYGCLETSSRKYSSSTRLMLVHFISSNVGPANNSGVRVSTLSLFITNAEKSKGVSVNSSNDSRGPSSRARLLNQG